MIFHTLTAFLGFLIITALAPPAGYAFWTLYLIVGFILAEFVLYRFEQHAFSNSIPNLNPYEGLFILVFVMATWPGWLLVAAAKRLIALFTYKKNA